MSVNSMFPHAAVFAQSLLLVHKRDGSPPVCERLVRVLNQVKYLSPTSSIAATHPTLWLQSLSMLPP